MNLNIKKGFAPIVIVLILAALLVLSGGVLYYTNVAKKPAQVACTQEAKQCPDGSYVSRTGPNCEFAACPSIPASSTPSVPKNLPSSTKPISFPVAAPQQISTSTWQRYWNRIYGFGISYPANHTLYSGMDTSSKTLVAAASSSDSVSIAEDESKLFSGTTPVLRMSVINADTNMNDWIDKNIGQYTGGVAITRTTSTLVGRVAVRISPVAPDRSFDKVIVAQPGNYLLVITQTGASPLLDKVFSTFSFSRN